MGGETDGFGDGSNWALRTLDYCFDLATNSTLGGIQKNCEQLAEEYARSGYNTEKAIDNVITWQCAKAGISGFATGLGGIVTLPATLPADLAALWFIQLRMVGAIGLIYGQSLEDDHVRTAMYATLLGTGVQESIGKFGTELAFKGAMSALKKMPSATLFKINQTVGFRLATKFGQKGLVNLVRLVPVVGGVVGGTMNATGTLIVGKAAKRLLRPDSSA